MNRMKQSIMLGTISAVLLFSSCSNLTIEDSSKSFGNDSKIEVGSITVNGGGKNRALNVSDMKYAKGYVTGSGIESPIVSKCSESDEEYELDGKGKGELTIENIPVGKNRIVTVYAYDDSKTCIYRIRAVTDINAGGNDVSVDKSTTLLGEVFEALRVAGENLSNVDKTAVNSKLSGATKNWSLYDATAIASDYRTSNGINTDISVYELGTGSISFKNYYDDCTIQVGDPVSSISENVVSGEGTLSGIAPGTWPVYVTKNGQQVVKTYATVASGNTTNIGNLGTVTDRIIVHCLVSSGYTKIYTWSTTTPKVEYFGAWSGKAMEDSDGDGWYDVEIPAASSNLIFNGDGQTYDLSREAGEWWYKDGAWTGYNPERPATPVVKASVAGGIYNIAQSVTLTSSNSSDKIYYTTDGSTPNASSSVYKTAIIISSSCTLKAIGYNADAATQWGEVLSVSYVIDADADLEAPVIVPAKEPGRYQDAISVSFTFTDNKGASGVTAYYTSDNSTPNTNSSKYTAGTAIPVAMDSNLTIRILAMDAAGNKATGVYYYSVGKTPEATRWDPRQESIYFLLTARWFDGDSSNSIGDENCSWTEARANDNIPSSEDGFTGPEDVSWRGDFKGLVEKMDYIKALGFTCIWITPVVQNRSPLCYHGYHAWDMYREDARLVSPGYDFQRVIDEAHARGMKICLDIVLQHSGRFGLKDFIEYKYNRDPLTYPTPVGWENFTYDEDAYESAYRVANKTGVTSVQKFPNGWEYDGLTSPGKYPAGYTIKIGNENVDVGGTDMPPYVSFVGDVRPFLPMDIQKYSQLAMNGTTASKFQWPTTETYVLTADTGNFSEVNGGKTSDYIYDQYVNSPEMHVHAWSNGFNDSGMFDKYPDANLRTMHEDCPDLNTESAEVQEYVINAYKRYIDMGVDMFRVDTIMHVDKKTLNDHFWPAFMEEAATANAKAARGGGDFFIFGEVANFVNNLSDKPKPLRQPNYTWDNTVEPDLYDISNNHLLNGNEYRMPDYSHKVEPSSDYHVSTIDIIAHNGFCDGVGGAYGRALGNDGKYNDATYLTWYTDSHDYGPNKGETRWQGDFAGAWSMLFTFRGIPIVYYGSEIRFAAGKPNDWPGGGSNGVNMSLEKTGRAYYGAHLEGTVRATDFGVYSASGEVEKTLSKDMCKHLRDLNKIRLAVPALQMGQYSTLGHSGGWAGYKRRYTGTNKITGEAIDSYCLVGVGSGTHTWTGVLDGTYIDAVSGKSVTVSGGTASFTPATGGDSTDAALVVLVHNGLTTKAPGKVACESPYFGY
ncbi:alpha-amylase family glycosyl hydrolase [uncultured Treponema sp.]|uniref:alpha-amylase family glycosyl hydrolase n=1 Tax=uncultured Treponema sp. TaxID=162155 RepID=UPI0025E74265|nr:alpha-amylase family glycosyl hydrolase [uncultured Treponema sp.]